MIRALLCSTALSTLLAAGPAMADEQTAPEADVAGKAGADDRHELFRHFAAFLEDFVFVSGLVPVVFFL